jgi:hypothetical protein
MKTVIEMAREAGFTEGELAWHDEMLERFAALARADEREKAKWDVHSCGPTCTNAACVAVREAVKAEREACANVAESEPRSWDFDAPDPQKRIASAIRARDKA